MGPVWRRLASLACLILPLLPTTFGAAWGEALRIGTDARYPPFTYFTPEGRLTGFEVDLGNQICDNLGVACQWVDLPFSRLMPALREGRIDAIMSSLSITPERRRLVAFSTKYYSTPIRFVVARDAPVTIDAAGLAGRRIGAIIGTTHVDHLFHGFSHAMAPILFETQGEMIDALISGGLDLVLGDSLGLWHFLNTPRGAGFTWAGNPVYVDEGIGIAVRQEDTELVERIDRVIDKLLVNGTFLRINARYFPFNIY
ncbi:ABC transporter substrate-binding protein [Skermanella stibiiresistens SB22]|uniref:ABC transporter substrate-binding protein n=1 Tax=Skermanella stibiiresistens SB22 TaxID=1385369 RepID=W9H8Y1_9PROT|nr:transporter substrate-binding domain-containing protein [Skermanella stibiiresistens]EWY42720.1 ABC transporter substrate-binding protein [Skermanella stibiiresistens SB22]